MPDWRRTRRRSSSSSRRRPGPTPRALRRTTTARPSTSSRSHTRPPRRSPAPRSCRRRHRMGPQPGAELEHERLRAGGLPGRDQRGDLADPARHLPFAHKLANAQAAGAVGVIMFNEGDSPGRMNAGFRAGPTDLAIPAVFSSYEVGKELYDAYTDGRARRCGWRRAARRSRTSIRRWWPRPARATPTTSWSPARTWTRSRPGRASTTTARARRGSSSWRSSSRSCTRSRSTRSASCGSAVRRTAWSARSTTPGSSPTPRWARST